MHYQLYVIELDAVSFRIIEGQFAPDAQFVDTRRRKHISETCPVVDPGLGHPESRVTRGSVWRQRDVHCIPCIRRDVSFVHNVNEKGGTVQEIEQGNYIDKKRRETWIIVIESDPIDFPVELKPEISRNDAGELSRRIE